jgi:saccharopine dehydrogenase-like NADP-dependent oxidoreductase
MTGSVLLVGATGYFGSLILQELLQFTDCNVTVAGRNKSGLQTLIDVHSQKHSSRLDCCVIDLPDKRSIERALEGKDIAICAAGPFQLMPETLPRLCIERRIHYIDLSDDRDFVRRVHDIANANPLESAVCSGWSTIPALSGALARICSQNMDEITEIHIQIAPGNRAPRSHATVSSLLASLGKQFTVCQNGDWKQVTGWSERKVFQFPQPIGVRPGYLVDVPDHFFFPKIFGAQTVEFRVGAELDLFNHALSVMAWTCKLGMVKNWCKYERTLQQLMSLTRFMGHDWGGVGVEVRGKKGKTVKRGRACVLATTNGHHIPAMPTVIMVSHLFSSQEQRKGIIPFHQWLAHEELDRECKKRSYQLIVEEMDR